MRRIIKVVKSELTEEQLEKLIGEAIMDCYDEYESINGFACSLGDHLGFPFIAKVVGEEVEVVGVDLRRDEVVAICKRKGKKHAVDILDLEVDSKNEVKGYEWIEAYRAWR